MTPDGLRDRRATTALDPLAREIASDRTAPSDLADAVRDDVHDARGCVGYLAKMFPRVSETFILREILTLRRQGIPLRIYSLLPPTRDHRVQTDALELLPEVVVLPQPDWSEHRRFLRDLYRCYRARPMATAQTVLRTILRPSRRTVRRLFRAVVLAEHLRSHHVAHLHAAWAHTPASVSRICSRLTGVPWSMSAHAKDIHLSRPGSLAKKLRSARFTTVCTRTYGELLRRLATPEETDLPAASILEYPHGVDVEYFTPGDVSATDGKETTTATILSVGRLVPKKGFDTLIDAAALLRDRGLDFRVDIIGTGPQKREIERRIRDRGLDRHVTLLGMKIHAEIRDAYRRATCFVLASRVGPDGDRDGIPNTLAEAMACGLPVVATRLPTIEELVADGTTGLVVEPGDPRALSAAIAEVLQDPARRQQLGSNARKHVEREFDARGLGERVARRIGTTPGIEKVLYVSADRGVPVRGAKGASVHVRSVVRALRERGIGVRLVTTRPGSSDGVELAVPMVQAGIDKAWKSRLERLARSLRGGTPLARSLTRLLDNVSIWRELRRQARAWHPDILYERYALTAVAGSLVARRLGIPHVIEVNAPLAEEEARFRGLRLAALTRWCERWVLRRAHRVVVVSTALEAHARRLGVRAERILVLPNAVDPALFNPERDSAPVRSELGLENTFVVGFSGALRPWHGLDHLVEAFAHLASRRRDARLLIVGDGPIRESLVARVRELGLSDRAVFAGHVHHEEIAGHLAACDVLTAPYGPMEDHWFSPLKVAEYLAMGRPVVASAVGQLEQMGGEDRGLVLVPPGDETALCASLTELAENVERRQQLGRRAAAGSTWTWSTLVRHLCRESEAARREMWGWYR
jgi:glycosyltransferase involved in cell wall biosynthesis